MIFEPNVSYPPSHTFRHRDWLGHVWQGPQDDKHLDPTNGSLVPLEVQASEDTFKHGEHTWRRLNLASASLVLFIASKSYSYHSSTWGERIIIKWLKSVNVWLMSCIATCIMVCLGTYSLSRY
jgi:hypothetical protein